jgi:hypothetical protein
MISEEADRVTAETLAAAIVGFFVRRNVARDYAREESVTFAVTPTRPTRDDDELRRWLAEVWQEAL